jgi:hypothetical protein|tara:strand:- start:324 stop:434 length:111 start_codon:yes stop_codon:yes gene_type:complete
LLAVAELVSQSLVQIVVAEELEDLELFQVNLIQFLL